MPKIVILGSSGMLGAYVSSYFRRIYSNIKIVSPSHQEFDIIKEITGGDFASSLNLQDGDVVVNCACMINKRDDRVAEGGEALFLRESISANSVFPQLMAMKCRRHKVRFVHISTDCVYDGVKGNYDTGDKYSATDIYGITKICGEPNPKESILIRTSIVGESKNGRSLVEWLRSQQGKTITGYDNHRWNGVTCLEIAKQISRMLDCDTDSGYFVVTSPRPITKYELCKKIIDAYGWDIRIEHGKGERNIDRTLVGNVDTKTIDEQIKEMVGYKF